MKRKLLYALMTISLLLLSACGSDVSSNNRKSAALENTSVASESKALSMDDQAQSGSGAKLSAEKSTSSNDDEKISETKSIDSESEPIELSTDEFITKVADLIDGAVGSDDSIDDISLENGNLLVVVTLGDPAPLSYEDLMFSRTSSITDSILRLEDCFGLWDTITIDFHEHGMIRNGHDNIQDDGYGAYFKMENFVITFNK